MAQLLVDAYPQAKRFAEFLLQDFDKPEINAVANALCKMSVMEFKLLCAAFDKLNAFAWEGATTSSVAKYLYTLTLEDNWNRDIEQSLAQVRSVVDKVATNSYWSRISSVRDLSNTVEKLAQSISGSSDNAPKINKLIRYLLFFYETVLGHKI